MSFGSSGDDSQYSNHESSDYPSVFPNSHSVDSSAAHDDAALARRIAEEELAIAREEQRLSVHSTSRGRGTSRVVSMQSSSHASHLSARASARLSSRGSARLNSRGNSQRRSVRSNNSYENERNEYDDQYDDVVMASPVDVMVDENVSGTYTPGRRTMSAELADNRMAQELLDREIMALEERQVYEDTPNGIDHSLDYMRPRNYTPYFSACVAIVCTAVMIVEIGLNGWTVESLQVNPLVGPGVDVLLKMGAKRTDLIVVEGEWYRLFTPIFLHSGVVHLIFNMVGLWNVGFATEREFGWLKTSVIFFVSGFFGVVMSAIFVPLAVGVGASGAIFGLFGSAWADLFQNWTLYRNQAWPTLIQLTFVTAINVCLGLVPFLDNFAHVGGLICGFICGLTLLVHERFTADGERKGRKNYQLCLQALSVIVLPVIILVMLLVLFLQVEAAKWCDWCSQLSCVPMPPGVPVEERWWDCTY